VSSPSEAPYGADDDQVAHRGRRAPGTEAEHRGDLTVARVAQHLLAPDHHRRLACLDSDGAQERFGLLVVLEVHPVVRHPVAGQEGADAAGVLGVARANHLHPGAEVDQDRPTRHERAEDQVAELLILGQQRPQARSRHLNQLARVPHHRAQVGGGAGDQIELAQEAVAAVHGDHPVLKAVALDDGNRARLDHEEVVAGVALAEEDLAGLDCAGLTDRAQARALLGVQPWEGTVAIGRLGHTGPERLAGHERRTSHEVVTTNIASST